MKGPSAKIHVGAFGQNTRRDSRPSRAKRGFAKNLVTGTSSLDVDDDDDDDGDDDDNDDDDGDEDDYDGNDDDDDVNDDDDDDDDGVVGLLREANEPGKEPVSASYTAHQPILVHHHDDNADDNNDDDETLTFMTMMIMMMMIMMMTQGLRYVGTYDIW